MFFEIDLLCPQKKGKFATAWIAATRGIKYCSRNKVLSINITELCNEILKMVMTESLRPKQRLSLTLAAKLISGTVIIYSRQVVILYEDMVKFLTTIRAPTVFEEPTVSPSEIVTKVKRKVRRKLPPSWENGLKEIVSTSIAPPEEITLRERVEPQVQEAVGFGTTTEEENAMAIRGLKEDVERESKRLAKLSKGPEERKQKSSSESEEEPPRKILVKALVHRPDEREEREVSVRPTLLEAEQPLLLEPEREVLPIEAALPSATRKHKRPKLLEVKEPRVSEIEHERLVVLPEQPVPMLEKEQVPQVEPVQEPLEQVKNRKHELKLVIKGPKKDVSRKKSKAFVKLAIKRTRCIDSPKELVDVDEFERAVVFFKPAEYKTDSDFINMVTQFFQESIEEDVLEAVRKVEESGSKLSSTGSLLLRKQSSLITPRGTQLSIPRASEIHLQSEIEKIKLSQELATDIPITSTPNIPVIPSIPDVPIVEPPGLEITQEEPQYMPIKTKTIQKEALGLVDNRYKYIIDIIKNWNFNAGYLQIEDVCKRPINKFNIAVTFNDLLHLCKQNIVELVSKPDSLEFSHINPGVKLSSL